MPADWCTACRQTWALILRFRLEKLPILIVSWSVRQCCVATSTGMVHCKVSACFTTGRLVPQMVMPLALGCWSSVETDSCWLPVPTASLSLAHYYQLTCMLPGQQELQQVFLRSSASMAAENPPPPRGPTTYHHQMPGQPQLPAQPGMPQAAGLVAPGYAQGQPGGPLINVGGQQMVQELQAMAAAQAASAAAAAAAAAPPAGPAGATSEVPGSPAAGMPGSVEPAGGASGPAVEVQPPLTGSAGTAAAGMPTAVGAPAPSSTAAVPASQPLPISGMVPAPHQAGRGPAVTTAAAACSSSPSGISLPAQAAAPAPASTTGAPASGQQTGQVHAAASTPHHPAEAELVSTTYVQANELQNVVSRQCGTGARPMLQHAPMVADAARRGGVQVSPGFLLQSAVSCFHGRSTARHRWLLFSLHASLQQLSSAPVRLPYTVASPSQHSCPMQGGLALGKCWVPGPLGPNVDLGPIVDHASGHALQPGGILQ